MAENQPSRKENRKDTEISVDQHHASRISGAAIPMGIEMPRRLIIMLDPRARGVDPTLEI